MKKLLRKIWIPIYLKNMGRSLIDPKKYYGYCHYFLHHLGPKWLLEHRLFFQKELRSYGEDSFNSFWYHLILENKPKCFLEIGVYRGQIISLIELMSMKLDLGIDVYGLSPLSNEGDKVSEYIPMDYEKDIELNYAEFKLVKPQIKKAFSDAKEGVDFIASRQWDCVYIDGNHDYEVVKKDYENVKKNLHPNGVIVFDDASLNLSVTQYYGVFKGHPGPSKLVDELVTKEMIEISRVGHLRAFKFM